ncbi:substrate-binding domain-containing protein [Halovivax sp.]|uniref:substrate-binding domain-containing protein n=1 Tax=Halovivax sp. TaxID=1935978 RepID=UPI0025C39191|nr:substrate-binding domain-containing protein [Halovivax sp.]
MPSRRAYLSSVSGAVATSLAGCTAFGAGGDGDLALATTTSAYESGLLDELHAAFTRRTGVRVSAVPRGTGAALRTARDGDADAVLVHARDLEEEFVRRGYGVERHEAFASDYVFVGPPGDPADVSAAKTTAEALETIANAEASFVSRGDDSGTHHRELSLWDATAAEPGGRWYTEVGQGMGSTLVHASEREAYALSDRPTLGSMVDNVDLVVLLDGPLRGGPDELANPYGVIAVDPDRRGSVDHESASAYVDFVTGPDGQEIVDEFRVGGERIFEPASNRAEVTERVRAREEEGDSA